MPSLAAYAQLVADLDRDVVRLASRLPLNCRPGCSHCCKPFAVLAVEAAILKKALAALPPATRSRLADQAEDEEQCPLLLDSLCAVYHHRPLICRTQGLAIAYVDHDHQAIEVSACPLNFPDDFAFAQPDLFFMDPFNDRLAAINLEFCARQGIAAAERLPLATLVSRPHPDWKNGSSHGKMPI